MNNADDATGNPRPSGTDQSADEVVDGELVEDTDTGADTDTEAPDHADASDASTDDDAAGPETEQAQGARPAASVAATGTLRSAPPSALSAPIPAPAFDYTDQGVPTLNYVRDKIENRYGTALGSAELAEAGDVAEQQRAAAEERDRLAREKLAELRRQVDGGTSES
jgi:hypothetical protein